MWNLNPWCTAAGVRVAEGPAPVVSISPSGGNGKYHLQDLHLLSMDPASCWVSCHIADFCYTSPFYSFCKTFYPSSSISSTAFWQWSTWVVKSSKNVVWTQDFNFPLGLFFHVSPTSQTIPQLRKNTFLISSPSAPKFKLTASQKKKRHQAEFLQSLHCGKHCWGRTWLYPLCQELGASLGYPPALALLLPASTAPLVPRKEQTKKD